MQAWWFNRIYSALLVDGTVTIGIGLDDSALTDSQGLAKRTAHSSLRRHSVASTENKSPKITNWPIIQEDSRKIH